MTKCIKYLSKLDCFVHNKFVLKFYHTYAHSIDYTNIESLPDESGANKFVIGWTKFPSTYVGSLPQLIAYYNEVDYYNINNDYVVTQSADVSHNI